MLQIKWTHEAGYYVMFFFRVLVMGDGEILEFDCPDILLQNKESHFYKLAHQEPY
jgi:ABC-type multidrug transport system fused ATPase/permease subunit